MKRYTVLDASTFESSGVVMALDRNGEWVKFDDVNKFYKITELNIDISDCNCEETYNELKAFKQAGLLGRPRHWICPAHGYKKL